MLSNVVKIQNSPDTSTTFIQLNSDFNDVILNEFSALIFIDLTASDKKYN